MSRTGNRLVALGCLAGLLMAAGCKPKPQVVATVNGVEIAALELARALPARVDSGADQDMIRRRVLEDLITRELFVQEAERLGLDKELEYQLERAKKALVTQELYNDVVKPAGHVTELELQTAHRLMQNEVHLKVIDVETEELALQIAAELDKGVPIETLAHRHSVSPSARNGGDLGYLPEVAIDEPVRSAVVRLEPGERTEPVRFRGNYQIALLVDRRPADPPPKPLGEMKQKLEMRVGHQKRSQLADEYLAKLRDRIEFNPEGLGILCKPVDSITENEKDIPVAVKDGAKYVKVERLLHVAEGFPPHLDTAMRRYAVRREIEEDLLYEEGLARGLDKRPAVQEQLAQRRRVLLYQTLFQREVAGQVSVTEQELQDYYEQHRSEFADAGFDAAAGQIRYRLESGERSRRVEQYRAGLRERAEVEISEPVLRTVRREMAGGERPAGKQ